MPNKKQTSPDMASIAGQTLASRNAFGVRRSLAASLLAQSGNCNEPSAQMAHMAGQAFERPTSIPLTKELAASVLSQSNPKRG